MFNYHHLRLLSLTLSLLSVINLCKHNVSPDLDPNYLTLIVPERICLLVLILYVPVNNFSVMPGQVFLTMFNLKI